jgi:hypothetical protein
MSKGVITLRDIGREEGKTPAEDPKQKLINDLMDFIKSKGLMGEFEAYLNG